jgi:hypothetical protein
LRLTTTVAFLILVLSAGKARGAGAPGQDTAAGQAPKVILDGYVSATHFPSGFDVNGEPVLVKPTTSYAWLGSGDAKIPPAASDDVKPGVYVEVAGARGEHGFEAVTVSLNEPREPRQPKEKTVTIKGFGLIVRVIAAESEPVYEADGYRIRVPAGATTNFSGTLKTLADVGPNVWVKYEAKRETTGELTAITVEFSPGRTGKKKPSQLEKDALTQDAIPAHAVLIDANGNFKTGHQKVRLSDAGGACGWHRLVDDPALEARVWRVGMSVAPAFQQQLAKDDAARIHFRFYVVEESLIRSEFGCASGLILVPRQVVNRLKNDSQLAAVLADGVAYNLQAQSPRWIEQNIELAGAAIGGDVLAQFYPWAGLGTEVSVNVVAYELERQMKEQCGRIDLGLMADAGYDPWQAPEAWRLLAPRKRPSDTSHLKYPSQAGYQLAILNQQYAHEGAAKPDLNGTKANAPAAK